MPILKRKQKHDITRSKGLLATVRARKQASRESVESFKVTSRLPSSAELPRDF